MFPQNIEAGLKVTKIANGKNSSRYKKTFKTIFFCNGYLSGFLERRKQTFKIGRMRFSE